jgi:Asp-tRNA(Asn)/Glu-tRNA(Gln) amidotransferase A subunit family amidase
MARHVAGLVSGMELLEPGFAVSTAGLNGPEVSIGRLRPPADERIDAAVDNALRLAEWSCRELDLPEWDQATADAGLLLVVEAWASNQALMESDPDGIGIDVQQRLRLGSACDAATIERAWAGQERWQATLGGLFGRFDFLVTPTLTIFPPALEEGSDLLIGRCTIPINLGGVPAVSLPVPTTGPLPASLQLIGPPRSEERLLAAAGWLESAIAGG